MTSWSRQVLYIPSSAPGTSQAPRGPGCGAGHSGWEETGDPHGSVLFIEQCRNLLKPHIFVLHDHRNFFEMAADCSFEMCLDVDVLDAVGSSLKCMIRPRFTTCSHWTICLKTSKNDPTYDDYTYIYIYTYIHRGFQKWEYPKMVGLSLKIPSINGWYLGVPVFQETSIYIYNYIIYIYIYLYIYIVTPSWDFHTPSCG